MMARYEQTKSDKWIKEKMVKHLGYGHDRKLIRQPLEDGHGNAEHHEIYVLHGTPIKAYAVRVRNDLSMYESSGKRWAHYQVNGNPAIKNEISHKNEVKRE